MLHALLNPLLGSPARGAERARARPERLIFEKRVHFEPESHQLLYHLESKRIPEHTVYLSFYKALWLL